MSDIVVIDIPIPPSANAMYGTGRGRVFISNRYRKWIKEAGMMVMVSRVMAGRKPISQKFKAMITVDQDLSQADLDNLVKPVIDLAQRHGIISNDKNSDKVIAGWGTAPAGCRLTIIPIGSE